MTVLLVLVVVAALGVLGFALNQVRTRQLRPLAAMVGGAIFLAALLGVIFNHSEIPAIATVIYGGLGGLGLGLMLYAVFGGSFTKKHRYRSGSSTSSSSSRHIKEET